MGFSHRRHMAFSILTAFLVSVGVIVVLDGIQDLPAAILATTLVVLSLVMGELVAQMLYRVGVINKLDITAVAYANLPSKQVFYRQYFYSVLIRRLLPSAAVAFVVALWPFPWKFTWKGFKPADAEQPPAETDL